MPLKKYIQQIEPRTINRLSARYDVLSYDLDNAYPQRVIQQCQGSPTAKTCWDLVATYIEGDRFENEDLNHFVINEEGLTMARLLYLHSLDRALFPGIAMHVNYNLNYEISSVHYVRWEDVRLCNPVSGRSGMLALYPDWALRTWRRIRPGKVSYHFPFDPDPKIIQEQVELMGGWENYNGQIYYDNPIVDDYSLAECDAVLYDIENESALQRYRNSTIQKGFSPSVIIFKKGITEKAEELDPKDKAWNQHRQTASEKQWSQFQGPEAASSIVECEYENDIDKPTIQVFQPQNVDKIFQLTLQTTVNNIIQGFNVPPDLVLQDAKNGLSNGGEKKVSMRDLNAKTKRKRESLTQSYLKVFPLLKGFKWGSEQFEIKPLQNEDTDEIIGVKAGPAIIQLLMAPLDPQMKLNTLIYVFNIPQEDAEKIILGGNVNPNQVEPQ